MTIKNLYISTAVLALLAVITFFLNRPSSPPKPDPRVGESVVAADTLQKADKIVFATGSETVTILNQPDSKKWVVEERADMPVDFPRLTRLINRLMEAKLHKLVSTNPERIETFGFDSGESIRFLDNEGNALAAIELGKDAEGGRQLMRFQGEEKAFLITDSFTLNAAPDSWLDKSLVDIDSENVDSLAITLANGESAQFSRDSEAEEATWTGDDLPADKIADSAAIDRLVSRVTGLSFTETHPTDAEEAIDARENSHRLVIGLSKGPTYTYHIGRRPEVKVEKEVQRTDDEGNTTKSMEEIVEQEEGPVFAFIDSSDSSAPINRYMDAFAFEIAEYQYTNLPSAVEDLLQDKPEETEIQAESDSEAAAPPAEGASAPSAD